MDLTISQALRKISKLKGQLKELLERAQAGVLYEEMPAFPFAATYEQAEVTREELIKLETAVRLTNAATKIDFQGKKISLSEATCRLQELRGKIAWLKALPTQAQDTRVVTDRQRDSYASPPVETVKTWKCDLTTAKRAEWVKREQDLFDALNDAVEAVNHRTTLVQG